MSHNGQHAHAPAGRRRNRRTWTIAGFVAVGLVALIVGVALGSRRGDGNAGTSPAATVSPSPAQEPSTTASASAASSMSPEPTPTALDEGRHFVRAKEVVASNGGEALVLDLAYFLTGDEANEAAAEDGLEIPLPNGYYIVNDNPRLRTVPIAPDASVLYIPADPCCDLQPWSLDAWADAVNGDVMTDMLGEMATTWWWVTVQDGRIVAIEQQYLP